MRCLVTGATGFVGSNLVRSLLDAGHDVLATGAPGSTTRYLAGLPVQVRLADLLDVSALPSLVRGCDWIFHVAGDTSTWRRLADRRRAVNVDAAGRLAAAALQAGVDRFIHTSTVDVHGYNRDGSALPEQPGDASLLNIGYDYADTKAAGEAVVLNYLGRGLDVVVAYPGFMIGPYDHTLQLGRIVRQMQRGERVFVPPGAASFCDVRAVAAGLVEAAARGRSGEGYNLAGFNHSYAAMFTRIGEIVGTTSPLIRLPARVLRGYGAVAEFGACFTGREPGMDRGLARYLSVPQASDWSKAESEFGYHPGDLDAAIGAGAAWYDEHLPVR